MDANKKTFFSILTIIGVVILETVPQLFLIFFIFYVGLGWVVVKSSADLSERELSRLILAITFAMFCLYLLLHNKLLLTCIGALFYLNKKFPEYF